jgi:hypothetical protein
LATLRLAAAAASDLLQPAPPAPCGPLGFGLELSALTPETAEALVRQARGALADLLTDAAASPARLSSWPGVDPDGEDMAGVALDFARARCAGALADLTIDDLVLQGLPDPQARLEALHGLLEAASPFLAWDETQLEGEDQGVVYSCALLGLGEGAAARALSGVGEVLFGQVLATGDDQRVTALCAVQGLPLAAVEGYGEGVTTNENNGWEEGNGGCPATENENNEVEEGNDGCPATENENNEVEEGNGGCPATDAALSARRPLRSTPEWAPGRVGRGWPGDQAFREARW